jgi:hypothetical protein
MLLAFVRKELMGNQNGVGCVVFQSINPYVMKLMLRWRATTKHTTHTNLLKQEKMDEIDKKSPSGRMK